MTRSGRARSGGRRASWGLVAALSLLGAAPPRGARAEEPRLAEALVAVVGARSPGEGTDVVLLSDVELGVALALARAGAHDVEPSSALRQAALDQLVGELLIQREATRLGASSPTPTELDAQRTALERSVGGASALAALLARLDAGDDELDAIVRRRAIVEHFLGANLEGASEVTDADVADAYANASHPFVGQPLEEVREALRAWLHVTLVDAYVARWLSTLRARNEVHVLRPFVARASSGEAPRSGGSDVEPR